MPPMHTLVLSDGLRVELEKLERGQGRSLVVRARSRKAFGYFTDRTTKFGAQVLEDGRPVMHLEGCTVQFDLQNYENRDYIATVTYDRLSEVGGDRERLRAA